MAWVASSLLMVPLALMAVLAAVPPLTVHMRQKNFAASVLVVGITVLNIQNFINAIIWHSEDITTSWDGKILCDIEVKLSVGMYQAINGANASIFRQIATILHPDFVGMTPSPRRRKITLVIDLVLCVSLPLYVMVGHYLIQRNRYWLRASAGCLASYDNNYAAPFLTYMWPMVVSLVGAIYCLCSIVRLYKHRKQMSSILSRTPGTTRSRFFRLFMMASTLLAIYCPLSVVAFAQNVRIPMHKYSWSYTHPPDWDRSARIFLDQHAGLGDSSIPFFNWAQVATAYLSFVFFGLGHEAHQMYKAWITQVKNLVRKNPKQKSKTLANAEQGCGSYELRPHVVDISGQLSLEHNQVTHPHHSNISELSG